MYIEHHGVKGQKWGVNRRSGGKSGKKVVPPSDDASRVRELRSKPIHSLSNKELKELNERVNLEQNYNRLNPAAVHKGRQKAQVILATAGLGVAAYNTVKSPAGQAVIGMGKKIVTGIFIGSKMA